MLYFLYDRTFDGLLTAVFDAFNRKEFPNRIVDQAIAIPLFTDTFSVITDVEKSKRVFIALKKKISTSALNMLFVCYLSEMEDVEMMIFRYIQKALASPISIELNFADNDVLSLSKIYKKVQNEAMHIKQFVRFQKTGDGMYFAVVDPLYDVLPLCSDFFEDRYADQIWLIYDARRHYGLYYDKKQTEQIHFETPPAFAIQKGRLTAEQQDETERIFQALWKDYLKSTTIQARKNLRLQRQFMPRRFWKYLVEKQ
ncbi:MAG: TIGR03915 family putative DNA repair protein [Dysgonamonadaceae bacterium]|jgi:probable DNA metabolism protein|nr:TIGR03915 family putative DNA repair protein [Dysgonamonadaceae bacterium]